MTLEARCERFAAAVRAVIGEAAPAADQELGAENPEAPAVSRPEPDLADRLVAATPGMDPATLALSLDVSLRPWADPEALVAAVRSDLTAAPGTTLVPPRTALVVLGGAVFASHVQAVAYPWLLGAHVRVKAPRVDPDGPAVWVQALGERVESVATADTLGVDVVVAVGGDDAVRALRTATPATAAFVGFGHRQAVAIVDAPDARLALDAGLYDQRGCLSVGEVLCPVGQGEAIATRLALGFEALPPRRAGADEAGIRSARDLAILEGRWWREAAGAFVSVAPGGPVGPTLGGRTVVVREVVDPMQALAPLAGVVGSVVLGLTPGVPWGRGVTLDALARLGASRVVRPGDGQRAGPDWPHDGIAPFAACCRRVAAS